MTRECVGHDANPEDYRGKRHSHDSNADNISAGPHHFHRVQKVMEVGGNVIFPDSLECMVADNAEFLEYMVCLKASGFLSWSLTSAGN